MVALSGYMPRSAVVRASAHRRGMHLYSADIDISGVMGRNTRSKFWPSDHSNWPMGRDPFTAKGQSIHLWLPYPPLAMSTDHSRIKGGYEMGRRPSSLPFRFLYLTSNIRSSVEIIGHQIKLRSPC